MVCKGGSLFSNYYEITDMTGTPILKISQFVIKRSTDVLKNSTPLSPYIFAVYSEKWTLFFSSF
jgi:hypothetical protein